MTFDDMQEIKNKIEEHEKRIAELETKLKSEPEIAKKEESIKEFIISKDPQDEIQKTLAICYYLQNYRLMKSLNKKDLEKGFREAKEKVPKNISDTVYRNIQKGFIAEAEEKKDKLRALYITNTGEKFVQNRFKKERI